MKPILIDANVLIDYAQSDDSVLLLATQHLSILYVPDPVVEEVNDLSESDYDRLNLTIIEPTTVQMLHAASLDWTPRIADKICFVLCQENQWICATNDKKVRTQCSNAGIEVMWGAQIMLELIKVEQLSADEAIEIMNTIQLKNPYIKQATVNRFSEKAREIETKR